MILLGSLREDVMEILLNSCLPCMILYMSSTEDLVERSLREDLAGAMSSRCLFESSCGRLLGGSCHDDIVSFSLGRGIKILAQVFYTSL